MENAKTVFVTGITGNQGSAAAKHLIERGHKLIGLTRNANSENSNFWKAKGVTIIQGNLNNPSSYQTVLNKADAVFLVQSLQKKDTEIKEGKGFIDVVNNNKETHLVYSSVLGSDLNTGVPHFDSKWELEQYIKSKELNCTVLRPASFYENHLHPQVSKNILKGKYMSPLIKTCKQQMIGVDDIGKIAAKVITNPDTYKGKTLSIATDEQQIGEIPQLFSKVMNKPVKYSKLPSIITRLAMGKDLYKMFKYMNEHNFSVVDNVNSIRKEFNIKGGFQSWIIQNFK